MQAPSNKGQDPPCRTRRSEKGSRQEARHYSSKFPPESNARSASTGNARQPPKGPAYPHIRKYLITQYTAYFDNTKTKAENISSDEWLTGHVRLSDPLPKSVMEKIVELATDGKSSSLSRGDFVVAMYLMNLLVDGRANRDGGPKYLPNYLPKWLKEVGTCLNSGGDAEAALRSAEDTVTRLGPPRHPQSSTTPSTPIRERPQNEQASRLDMVEDPLPSYSPHYVSMQPRQGDRAQRELSADKIRTYATPSDSPLPYSNL